MEIRVAGLEDAEAISALNGEVQGLHAASLPAVFKPPAPDSFPADRVRTLIGTPGVRLWIAHERTSPAGYLYAEIARQGENSLRRPHGYVYVNHICVSAAFRRRGIGRSLLQSAQSWAEDEDMDSVVLDVWGFNTGAQAFFARLGFEPFTVRLFRNIRPVEG